MMPKPENVGCEAPFYGPEWDVASISQLTIRYHARHMHQRDPKGGSTFAASPP